MAWPRGKYNGERILGVSMKVVLNLGYWVIRARWNFGMPYIICGPLQLRFRVIYGSE